jgi:diguanylate cyclase (GGDEF)-like protein
MNGTVSTLESDYKHIAGWHQKSFGEPSKSICAMLLGEQMILHKPINRPPITNGKVRLARRYKRIPAAEQEALRVRQLLATSLDALDVGLEIWDEQDRLVLYNNKINQLHEGFHTSADIGQTFEQLTRAELEKHLIKTGVGHEEEWLAQRIQMRGKNTAPLLHELADDRWVNTYETRTPENFLIVAWVEVTDLVRKGRVLEALNHRLAHQSATDGLTGLANRRRFDEALASEWLPDNRSENPLSLLMIDIDHFKLYNDHYGHLAGDECLRRVAGFLEQCVRRNGELVARFGGEEFVMLLPGSDLAHACETAQKCLDLLRDEAIPHAASPLCDRLTLSIGVACLEPGADHDVAYMLNAADTAMYRAKSGGRACFKVAEQTDWKVGTEMPRTGT